jgi:hypothetical protein
LQTEGDWRGVWKIWSQLRNNATPKHPYIFFLKIKIRNKISVYLSFYFFELFYYFLIEKITRGRGIMGIFRQKEQFSKVLVVWRVRVQALVV